MRNPHSLSLIFSLSKLTLSLKLSPSFSSPQQSNARPSSTSPPPSPTPTADQPQAPTSPLPSPPRQPSTSDVDSIPATLPAQSSRSTASTTTFSSLCSSTEPPARRHDPPTAEAEQPPDRRTHIGAVPRLRSRRHRHPPASTPPRTLTSAENTTAQISSSRLVINPQRLWPSSEISHAHEIPSPRLCHLTAAATAQTISSSSTSAARDAEISCRATSFFVAVAPASLAIVSSVPPSTTVQILLETHENASSLNHPPRALSSITNASGQLSRRPPAPPERPPTRTAATSRPLLLLH